MRTKRNVVHRPLNNKIIIPIAGGCLAANPSEIIMFVTNHDKVEIHRTGNRKVLIALKTLEQICTDYAACTFVRISRFCVINTDHLEIFMKEDGGQVLLTDGKDVHVTDSYREPFIKWLNEVSRNDFEAGLSA